MREIFVDGRIERWQATEYTCINAECPGGAVWSLIDASAPDTGAITSGPLFVCDACGSGFRDVLSSSEIAENESRVQALQDMRDDGTEDQR